MKLKLAKSNNTAIPALSRIKAVTTIEWFLLLFRSPVKSNENYLLFLLIHSFVWSKEKKNVNT